MKLSWTRLPHLLLASAFSDFWWPWDIWVLFFVQNKKIRKKAPRLLCASTDFKSSAASTDKQTWERCYRTFGFKKLTTPSKLSQIRAELESNAYRAVWDESLWFSVWPLSFAAWRFAHDRTAQGGRTVRWLGINEGEAFLGAPSLPWRSDLCACWRHFSQAIMHHRMSMIKGGTQVKKIIKKKCDIFSRRPG